MFLLYMVILLVLLHSRKTAPQDTGWRKGVGINSDYPKY